MNELTASSGIEYSGEIGWVSSFQCVILDASVLPLVEVLTDENVTVMTDGESSLSACMNARQK